MHIHLIQGTPEWLAWRRKGLGSSEAAVIMGVSPYQTLHQLFEIKTGRQAEQDASWIMDKGNQAEPRARAMYELRTGLEMAPELFVHPEHDFIRASLDGYNEAERGILEIKYTGKDDYELVKGGGVPERYLPQVQHQLMTTGARWADLLAFHNDQAEIVRALPDADYMSKLFVELSKFWAMIQADVPPPLCKKDFKLMQSKDISPTLREWEAAPEPKPLELEYRIMGLTQHPRIRTSKGFYITKTEVPFQWTTTPPKE